MFTNPEQFANATKALFEFQLETFNTLTSKTVQGVEQVIALNMSTAKSQLEDSLAAGKEISQAQDPKAALKAAADQIQQRAGRSGQDRLGGEGHQITPSFVRDGS